MDSLLIATVLAGIPLPVLLIDRQERIAAANEAAHALFGSGIVGRHHILTLRQPGLLDAIEGTLRHRQPGQGRHTITGPAREITYRVTVSPINAPGEAGAICVFEDITEIEQMGHIRRDFVANVSHELRTPLTALLGFIETLKFAARDDPAARTRFLDIMEREAERMNRLVGDLLQLSRVEADERVRPTERIDVAALVLMTIAALRPMADAAGVVLEVSGDTEPLMLPADADQLTQVFHNLIENGVKYGGSGKVVRIAIRREARSTVLRGPAVEIAVTDEGEGIDAIHLPRLTERFYRVDSHRSREKGGTGLGLAIVKHIVNRHRGRFRIESTLGAGSTFTVTLPEG